MSRYDALNNLCGACHETARFFGFWDEPRNKGELIALMHSELSKLLEAIRKPEAEMSKKCPELTEEAEEAADVFIRLADYCGGFNINLGRAVMVKRSYNTTRAHMHGKRF